VAVPGGVVVGVAVGVGEVDGVVGLAVGVGVLAGFVLCDGECVGVGVVVCAGMTTTRGGGAGRTSR
jgi:hypothetical protein